MPKRLKTGILVLLGITIIIILLKPNLTFLDYGKKQKEFQVTQNADKVLAQSIKQKHPVFLEFYAKW